jgi:hypothetical protein
MISAQKARRIAYGMIVDVLKGSALIPAPHWEQEERVMIAAELARIETDMKKKSQ